MTVDGHCQSLVATAPGWLFAASGRQRRHSCLDDEVGAWSQIRNGRRHFERTLLAGREDERVAGTSNSQRRLRNHLDLERVATVAEPHLVWMPGQVGERNF